MNENGIYYFIAAYKPFCKTIPLYDDVEMFETEAEAIDWLNNFDNINSIPKKLYLDVLAVPIDELSLFQASLFAKRRNKLTKQQKNKKLLNYLY
jgi:hypothetical protein